MHTDSAVLKALRGHYSPEELSAVLHRVLRVPEAWAALHNPGFLAEVIASQPPSQLTPSHLAALALGGDLAKPIQPQLAEPHLERAELTWQEADLRARGTRDLFETALLGLEFLRRLTSASDPSSLIMRAGQSPRVWQSPLALIWPALPDLERTLAQLIEADGQEMAIQIAMSNLPVEEAGSHLLRSANGSTVRLMQEINRIAEHPLAHGLAQAKNASPEGRDTISQLLVQAISGLSAGEFEASRGPLRQAWQMATRTAAQIAELTAWQARLAHDPVTELEANRQALTLEPTPARRAWTAMSLMKLDRLGEALAMISSEPPAVEEQIAHGVILTHAGQPGRAALQAALTVIDASTRLDDTWFELLADSLWSAGDRVLAVEAASKRIERSPANASARTHLAQLLFESGDSETSAEQAELALTLSPGSQAAGQILAKSLQDLGRFSEASGLWKGLQAHGAGDPEALAECAIRAGELELATGAAGELLQLDPNSQAARVIEGRILVKKGEPAAGRLKIEAAVEMAPQGAEPYLALADLHDESGDQRQVGETLTRAAQVNPGSAAIRLALAQWLRSQGRLSEAFEAATRALELDPGNLDIVSVHADLLRQLGHIEQAVANLRTAAVLKPRSWRIGLALAQALEARGEHEEAASLAGAIPMSAPPESLLIAAQIGVSTGNNPDGAIKALTQAEQAGLSSPELDYWFGMALAASGRPDLAMKRFEQALLRLPDEQVELREATTLGIARSALGTGQISLALSTLEQALQWFRGSTEILALMSLVYQSANLPDKAIDVAKQAVEANSEAPGGWTALGKALAGSGDFQGAIEAFARTSELEPSDVSGWLELSGIATQKGERSIARRAVAEAVWRGRRRPEVLVKAASLLSADGSHSSAQRLLRAGMRKRPEDAALSREFANLTEQAGDLEAALRAWLNCAEIEPHEPEPLRRAAAVAVQLGQLEKSIDLLERAVGLAPRNGKVRRELAGAYLKLGRVQPGLAAYEAASKELSNDPTLPLEAADAALLAGAIDEALQWTERAQQVAADPGRIQAAQGEAYLSRYQWEAAETALGEAIALGNMAPRVLAMLSIIASRTDLSAAKETLDRAVQTTCESSHDAIWVCRAHLRMLDWDAALRSLEPWKFDVFARREFTRVTLRTHDARWLFREAGALMAAPQMDGQSLLTSVETALHDLRQLGFTEDSIESLQQLLEVARDPARATSLAEHAENDSTGVVGESLTLAHLRAGRADGALESIARVQRVCPNPEWASLLEGLGHAMGGNPAYARTAYRRALQDPVLSPLGNFLLGRAYAAANRPELAASHLNAAVTAWPEEHVWQRTLGMHYAEFGEPDPALVHLQQALAVDERNPIYRLDLARLYRQSGQLSQAEEAYSQATQVNADSSEAFREAAEVALEIGKIEKAAEWFGRASAIAPSDHRNLIGAALAASGRGDRQRASELLAAAIQISPDSAEVLMGQGRIEARAGEVEAAMRTFERALSAGAHPSQVRRAQSKLLLERGQAGRAIPALEQAVEADPNDHGLWHELALAREAGSDWRGADAAVSEAVRVAPLNCEYRVTSGRIARRSGQLDRAVDELRGAADLAPTDSRVCIETGLVYEDRREFARALDWYRKAIALDPDRLEAFYRAGVLLRTLKAYRKAGEMLKRAAELAPVNQDVLHQLAAVRALELVHG